MKRALTFCSLILLLACSQEYRETRLETDKYVIPEGLRIEAFAAEPLIEAPVDISFDDQGRLWVLEMRGYMRSLAGTGEDEPVGRIVILEDSDDDGIADHRKIFLDSLSLARSIAHVYGGLLVAEPPSLWFYEIGDDLAPGHRVLVDSTYAVGGNVEHQPNGLLLNIDNWIYNAKSTKRYRQFDGVWVIEQTAFRGQWGLTRDPMGRLLYNDNSNQLLGDHVLPGILKNPAYRSKELTGWHIVNDQRVYPLQPTPVNRGYVDGVLDEEGKLRRVTSACGPLVYEGILMPPEYNTNAFVCVPEANIVKRNILDYKAHRIYGRQAWEGREFIASTDLGFRPVNLKNGPDGALYIADMHRGIIQHKTYMTSYLRDQLSELGLDSLTGMGRILRMGGSDMPVFRELDLSSMATKQLIDLLESPNNWIRDRAQHLLQQREDESSIDRLLNVLRSSDNEIARIHALYTLEGLTAWKNLSFEREELIGFPYLRAHILSLAAEGSIVLNGIDKPIDPSDSSLVLYSMYHASQTGDTATINSMVYQFGDHYGTREILIGSFSGDIGMIRDTAIQGSIESLREREQRMAKVMEQAHEDTGLDLGLKLFRQQCAVCHGSDGEGLTGLAPPLLGSEFVAGDPEMLANILLYGLSGPIRVGGKDYDFPASMTGLISNNQYSDEDIKSIMDFIRNSFTTSPRNYGVEVVEKARNSGREYGREFTHQELKEAYPGSFN